MAPGVVAQIVGPDGLVVLVVILALLFFGGSKLPQLARGLGGASRELRSATDEFKTAADAGRAELALRPQREPADDTGRVSSSIVSPESTRAR